MTNKEAIIVLNMIECHNPLSQEAKDLAIKALEDKGYAQGYIDGQTGADYDEREYD